MGIQSSALLIVGPPKQRSPRGFKKKTASRGSVTVTFGGSGGPQANLSEHPCHQADRGLIAHSWRCRARAGASPGWAVAVPGAPSGEGGILGPSPAPGPERARRAAGAAPAGRGLRPGGCGRRRWGPTRAGGGGEAARAKSRPLGRSARRSQRLGQRRTRSEVREVPERRETTGRWARGGDSGTSTRSPGPRDLCAPPRTPRAALRGWLSSLGWGRCTWT